jgi:hypothetical protein
MRHYPYYPENHVQCAQCTGRIAALEQCVMYGDPSERARGIADEYYHTACEGQLEYEDLERQRAEWAV